MNINKLVLWNMSQPYHKRVAANELQERVEVAREVANVRALHRQIHAEIDAKIQANIEALENL